MTIVPCLQLFQGENPRPMPRSVCSEEVLSVSEYVFAVGELF